MAEEKNVSNEEVKEEEVKAEVSGVEIEINDDTPEEDQKRKNVSNVKIRKLFKLLKDYLRKIKN